MTMKRLLITGTIFVSAGVFAACQPAQQSQSSTPSPETQQEATQDAVMEKEGQSAEEVMTEKPYMEEDVMEESSAGRYMTYSQSAYESAKDQTRVFFFHATWCPTCKQANEEFTSQAGRIPENVVVLKTDYDSEKELKQKYGITYQHTFVQVDAEGNMVKKWNGGGVDKLVSEVQ